MAESIPEPVERRPWRKSDGPEPTVWCWPNAHRPALYVWSRGKWRYGSVMARHDYADGAVAYQVAVNLGIKDMGVTARTYGWPQPGLRVAQRSPVKPTTSGT
ncbi:hypothetical protein [Streptomyces bacillaris]|uniref:hypothetical protein n=1 Tax=Streptomyces bacillaris TaxID=68179 RepID=UPI0036FD30E1